MQGQYKRLLILIIILLMIICFILLRSDSMMQELDQQMPVIGCTVTSFETRL